MWVDVIMINYVDYLLLMSQKYIFPQLTSQERKTLNSMLVLWNNKLFKSYSLKQNKTAKPTWLRKSFQTSAEQLDIKTLKPAFVATVESSSNSGLPLDWFLKCTCDWQGFHLCTLAQMYIQSKSEQANNSCNLLSIKAFAWLKTI